MQDMKRLSKVQESFQHDGLALRSDGSTFPVQVSVSMGRVRGKNLFAAFITDNTVEQLQKKLLETEKGRSEKLLLNILPASIARRLKNNERPIADAHDAVTCVFIDMVGFTTMSSGMTPTDLVELLNAVFSAFDELANYHRIEKIKTIGDCFMAVGGLFGRFHDHAKAVTEFALDVVRFMGIFNNARNTNLNVRVGLNTGPVVAGVCFFRFFLFVGLSSCCPFAHLSRVMLRSSHTLSLSV